MQTGDTGGSNRGPVADMSSHRGAEPEVKLCLLQSFRPTLQAAPWGGPFYGSLGLKETEREKWERTWGSPSESGAAISVLENKRALKKHYDAMCSFCLLWSINYKSPILNIATKHTNIFFRLTLASRQKSVSFHFSTFHWLETNYHRKGLTVTFCTKHNFILSFKCSAWLYVWIVHGERRLKSVSIHSFTSKLQRVVL